MPAISRFNGIAIYIFWDDHAWPHIHARYAEYRIVFNLVEMEFEAGRMPPRQRRMISEWARTNEGRLLDNWRRMENHEPLIQIPG